SAPRFQIQNINDRFGKGKKWTLVYSSKGHPTLTQTFRIYKVFLLADIEISSKSKELKTNYMAPVVAYTDTLLYSQNRRKLFVPFDNAAWIRYATPTHIDST
ncbi:alpha-galactosidase, partial [Bacillus pumilus]